MTSAEMNKFCRSLRSEGFSIATTGRTHLKITHPGFVGCVFASSTPSDWRATRKVRAMLKRKMREME